MKNALQLIIAFWNLAKKYAKTYTDSRMEGLIGIAFELRIEDETLELTIRDSAALTASIQNGTMILNY